MGIDTLTTQKFLDEVARVRSELVADGESYLSLSDIGHRKVCKAIIKEALLGIDDAGNTLDFDPEADSFVIRAEDAHLSAEALADSVDTVESDDSDDSVDETDEAAASAVEADALPF